MIHRCLKCARVRCDACLLDSYYTEPDVAELECAGHCSGGPASSGASAPSAAAGAGAGAASHSAPGACGSSLDLA